jgi:hypothetical protein
MIKQVAESYATKHHRSYYRTFSIRDNLHRIETPLLVIAGSIDELTPADDLKFVFDRVSSQDKEFVVVGKESGASEEYGHVDLILGNEAPRDVYPIIQGWIDRHELDHAVEAPPGEASDADKAAAPDKPGLRIIPGRAAG